MSTPITDDEKKKKEEEEEDDTFLPTPPSSSPSPLTSGPHHPHSLPPLTLTAPTPTPTPTTSTATSTATATAAATSLEAGRTTKEGTMKMLDGGGGNALEEVPETMMTTMEMEMEAEVSSSIPLLSASQSTIINTEPTEPTEPAATAAAAATDASLKGSTMVITTSPPPAATTTHENESENRSASTVSIRITPPPPSSSSSSSSPTQAPGLPAAPSAAPSAAAAAAAGTPPATTITPSVTKTEPGTAEETSEDRRKSITMTTTTTTTTRTRPSRSPVSVENVENAKNVETAEAGGRQRTKSPSAGRPSSSVVKMEESLESERAEDREANGMAKGKGSLESVENWKNEKGEEKERRPILEINNLSSSSPATEVATEAVTVTNIGTGTCTGTGTGTETGAINLEKLLNTIEMTKKATLLQQRLALASSGGVSGDAGGANRSMDVKGGRIASFPSSSSSSSGIAFRTAPTPGSAPVSGLRKRKSMAQLNIGSSSSSSSTLDESAPPVPPLPSFAPRPIASYPASPLSPRSPSYTYSYTHTHTPSTPAAPLHHHHYPMSMPLGAPPPPTLVSPMRTRFDAMRPFRGEDSPEGIRRRKTSEEEVISVSPGLVALHSSPSSRRIFSGGVHSEHQQHESQDGAGAPGSDEQPHSPSSMSISSSPRKRSRMEGDRDSDRDRDYPGFGRLSVQLGGPPASPSHGRMSHLHQPQQQQHQQQPQQQLAYRRPSTHTDVLAENGLIGSRGSTSGLQQKILGHRRVHSGSAYPYAHHAGYQGPIRTLDDLERCGTLQAPFSIWSPPPPHAHVHHHAHAHAQAQVQALPHGHHPYPHPIQSPYQNIDVTSNRNRMNNEPFLGTGSTIAGGIKKKNRSLSHSVINVSRMNGNGAANGFATGNGIDIGHLHDPAIQQPDKMDLDAANALTAMLGGGTPIARARSHAQIHVGSPYASSAIRSPMPQHNAVAGNVAVDVFEDEPHEGLGSRRKLNKTRTQEFASTIQNQPFTSPSGPPTFMPARYNAPSQSQAQAPATPSRRINRPSSDTQSIQQRLEPNPKLDYTDRDRDNDRDIIDESSDEDKKAAELMIFLAQSPGSPLKRDATPAGPASAPAADRRKSSVNATPGGIGRILFEDHIEPKRRGMAGFALEDSLMGRPNNSGRKLSMSDLIEMPVSVPGLSNGGDVVMRDTSRQVNEYELGRDRERNQRIDDIDREFPLIDDVGRNHHQAPAPQHTPTPIPQSQSQRPNLPMNISNQVLNTLPPISAVMHE